MSCKVFITGAYRSGTTLLDKVLSNHPLIKIGSQPFPFLFFHIKNRFYKDLGIERKYPLDDLFLETKYKNENFNSYLKKFCLSGLATKELLNDMKDYSGCLTPQLLRLWESPIGGGLDDIYNEMLDKLKVLFNSPDETLLGTKEIFGEEFIPYFLEKGYKVVLVIRDPRNIITSLNYGKGEHYTGKIRPILYSIRVWRKSVAFALQFKDYSGFTLLRFEDLINDTEMIFNNLADSWNIPQFPEISVIKDQFGNTWKGNSSFTEYSGIQKGTKAKYLSILNRKIINFIESSCYPELIAMGYDISINKQDIDNHINSFREAFVIERDGFPADYSHNETAKKNELKRLEYVFKNNLTDNFEKWFLFKSTYDFLITGKSLF
jgi:sulfotransferase family protein